MTWCCVVSSVDRSGLCRVLESGLCRVRWCRVVSESVGWYIESVPCRVVLCRVSVLDRIVLRIVYVYGLVWSCYVSCGRVVRIGLVWCRGSIYESYGSVSSRVEVRFGCTDRIGSVESCARIVLRYTERSDTRSGCV